MKRHSHHLHGMRQLERSMLSLVSTINKNDMSNSYTHVVTCKRSAYAERCPDRTYMEQIADRQNRFVWSEKHLYRPHKHYTYDPCSWGRELEESSKMENKKLSVVERLEQLRERALERATNVELVNNKINAAKENTNTNEEQNNNFQCEEHEQQEEEVLLMERDGVNLHKEEHSHEEEEQEMENTLESEMPYYFYDESDNSNVNNSNINMEMPQSNTVCNDGNKSVSEEEEYDNSNQSLQSLIDDVQRLHDLLTAPRHSNKPILRLQEQYEEEMKKVVVELYNRFSEARVNVNMTYNALIIVAYHILRNIHYLTAALENQEKENCNSDIKSYFFKSLAETHARIRAVYERQILDTFEKDKSNVLETLLNRHTSPEMCIELLYILTHPLLIHDNTTIDERCAESTPIIQAIQEVLKITFTLINERICGNENSVDDNNVDDTSNSGELLDSEHLYMLLRCCALICQKLALSTLHNTSSLFEHTDTTVNLPLLRFVLERSLNSILKLCTMTINDDIPSTTSINWNVNNNINITSLHSVGNDMTNWVNTNIVNVHDNNNNNSIQQTLRRRVLRRSYRHPLLQEEHQKHLHIISCEDTLSLRGPKAIPLDPPTHPRGLISSVLAPNEMSQITNAVECYLTLLNLQSSGVTSTVAEHKKNNSSSNVKWSKQSKEWATNERIIHKFLKITSYSPNYDLDVSACAQLAVTLFEMSIIQKCRDEVWNTISCTVGQMTSSSLAKLSAAAVHDVLSTNDASNNMLRLILLLSRLEYNCVKLENEDSERYKEHKNYIRVNVKNITHRNNESIHFGGKVLLSVLLLHLCNFRITRVPYEHQQENEIYDHVHNNNNKKRSSASFNDNTLRAERIVAVLEAEWFRLRGHAVWKILQELTISDLLIAEKYYTKHYDVGSETRRNCSSNNDESIHNNNKEEEEEVYGVCWETCLAFGSFRNLVPLQLWRSACLYRLRGVVDTSLCKNTNCTRCVAEALLVLRSRYASHQHASKRVPVDDESVKYIAACVSVLLSQRVSVHDLCTSWENWDVMSILASLTHEENVQDVSALLSEVREFLIARCEDAKKVITF